MTTPIPPKLKFRCMYWDWGDQIPNGYRFATVEEVRGHYNTITRFGIPKLDADDILYERDKLWFLGGYITYPYHHTFQSQQMTPESLRMLRVSSYNTVVLVKEKDWDARARQWRTKRSACYSSDGLLLKKQVYHHLTLSPQARQSALLMAAVLFDTEVFYWLLTTTSSQELEIFKTFFNKLLEDHNEIEGFYPSMVRCLLSSNFPFQLPLQLGSYGHTAIYYAVQDAGLEKIDDMCVVELLVNLFSAKIVHWKDSQGMSFLDMVEGEEERTHLFRIFAKLLSLSELPFENHLPSIDPRYEMVLMEALRRGYVPLMDKLLHFRCDIPIDVFLLMGVLKKTVERRQVELVEKLFKFEDYEPIDTNEFVEVLKNRGHRECVQNLLELVVSKLQVNQLVMDVDRNGKTLIQYAAESGDGQVFHLLVEKLLQGASETGSVQSEGSNLQGVTEESQNIVRNLDKFGRSILHWASLVGEAKICERCVRDWNLKVDTKDSWGQNSLHFAAKSILGHRVVDLLIGSSSSWELIYSRDYKGRTPLHLAAAVGNIQMVERLLRLNNLVGYIQQSDMLGRTALHMAVRGGHEGVVKLLLERGSEPLAERDMRGQTSLHYATQVKDPYVAVALSRRLLHKYSGDSENKALLLWASADGSRTADENEQTDPYVRSFLEKKRTNAGVEIHLLKAAAVRGNVQMAGELINRGANLEGLHDDKWRDGLDPQGKTAVENLLNEIALANKSANKRGHDKPSLEDNLGRSIFAEGLASLFLNKLIESPITVGICGDWGKGKSSLMIQTERILLLAASQLTFPNLFMFEEFKGAELLLNSKGVSIYQNFKKGVGILLGREEKYSSQTKNPLVHLLEKYQPEHREIYKSIACMDRNQMLKTKSNQSIIQSQSQVLRGVPRILIIQYNAWQYRNEQEAWGGLAVRITEEIEKSMTRAQRFATCWNYSWNKHRMTICLEVFFPFFIATIISGLVAWGAWILLSKGKLKELKFGSILCTVVATAWVAFRSVISVVKPVSEHMMGYVTTPDHSSSLGYQQKVISDINFLKDRIGRKPCLFFSFLSGQWCLNWFGLAPDNIGNTGISKFQPASEDDLRIITFVDDLDRCEEKVILNVLSAINLVLAECKINVILGMDRKMIERAIKRNFEDNDDPDLADKFICKIIQIPLSLPDPTEEQSNSFLENQLGRRPLLLDGRETDYSEIDSVIPVQDGGETDYGEIDSDTEHSEIDSDTEHSEIDSVFDVKDVEEEVVIESWLESNVNQICWSTYQGIIKNLLNCWLDYLKFLYIILRNLWHFEYKSKHFKKIHPIDILGSARLMRERMTSNYSQEEVNLFYELKSFVTNSQKLPREWKRMLNYHKLAFNILSIEGKVHYLPRWKEQLVAWIFVCWQWKREMNTIIEGWSKFALKAGQTEDGNARVGHRPSLREIIEKCAEFENSEKRRQAQGNGKAKEGDDFFEISEESKQSQGNSTARKGDDFLEVRGRLRQEKSLTLYVQGHARDAMEEGPSVNSWDKLKAALRIQDVSMTGIQLFQQFRFHCETDHLPWPVNVN